MNDRRGGEVIQLRWEGDVKRMIGYLDDEGLKMDGIEGKRQEAGEK